MNFIMEQGCDNTLVLRNNYASPKLEQNNFKCEGQNLDKGIELSRVGVYAQNLQFTAGFSGGRLLRRRR